ncbi:hypothetical protein [Mucilaginibacter glaciei]|uniref:Uncharacterized protein n=1 Tax=Mucilaginibacter glaciei TaxID=2772109 RepID=A0A926NID9_9SPHI|nr:hypothetical protein [Mucilaginibacter glaciei]MBD1391806.1 hypothetical protein [Mucilaginibacter glaciei]
MTNSILEITENEYLIKLNRSNFNLSFIRSLLKIVEVSEPAKAQNQPQEHDDLEDCIDVEIPNRNYEPQQGHSSEPDYYSNLDEK